MNVPVPEAWLWVGAGSASAIFRPQAPDHWQSRATPEGDNSGPDFGACPYAGPNDRCRPPIARALRRFPSIIPETRAVRGGRAFSGERTWKWFTVLLATARVVAARGIAYRLQAYRSGDESDEGASRGLGSAPVRPADYRETGMGCLRGCNHPSARRLLECDLKFFRPSPSSIRAPERETRPSPSKLRRDRGGPHAERGVGARPAVPAAGLAAGPPTWSIPGPLDPGTVLATPPTDALDFCPRALAP